MDLTSTDSAPRPPTGTPPGGDAPPATPPQLILFPRRLALLLWAAGAGLVVWTIYLGDALPERQTAEHWDVAWIGLDVFMILAIAVMAWGAWQQRQILIPASLAAAVLLVVDAWLDTTMASPGRDATVAYLMAGLLEIPAAICFALIARHAFRVTIAGVSDIPIKAIHSRDVPPAPVPALRADSPASDAPIAPVDG